MIFKLTRVYFGMAVASLRQNRMRTFLTCLGIAIGVGSIVLVLSLTGSVDRIIRGQTRLAGDHMVLVRPHQTLANGGLIDSGGVKSSLLINDVIALDSVKNVKSVTPIIRTHTKLSAEKTVDAAAVIGTAAGLADIMAIEMRVGSFIEPVSGENVAVIGRELSLNLFGTTHAVGKVFRLFGHQFMVIGVMRDSKNLININNIDLSNTMMVRADYLSKINPQLRVDQISVKLAEGTDLKSTAAAITSALDQVQSGRDLSVLSGREIEHAASPMFIIVSIMLAAIAGVSLVVGGIGVMNIMLVSVNERTREIGIRKAVGASGLDIMTQFLLEALMLTVIGGILGLGLGYLAAAMIAMIIHVSPYVSVWIFLVTLSTSILTGVIFGLYPAMKAARKNPIDSLKFYR